jgi:hypothetical protein
VTRRSIAEAIKFLILHHFPEKCDIRAAPVPVLPSD